MTNKELRDYITQILPIITPDLPIPTRSLNPSFRPEFLNPNVVYENSEKESFLIPIWLVNAPLALNLSLKNSGFLKFARFLFGGGLPDIRNPLLLVFLIPQIIVCLLLVI